MSARINILPWFFNDTLKLFFVYRAIENRRTMASKSRIVIIILGVSSSSKNFVAINEVPQKITANKGSQYLIEEDFKKNYFDFSVFLAEE